MAPKRNDPCHCGSGKKYKHCHMKEDREKAQAEKIARQTALSAPSHSVVPPSDAISTDNPQPEEPDPEAARLNQLYEKFEAAKYAEKIVILRAAIEEKALDDELTFEFFNDLYPHMVERDDRVEFAELVTLLQTYQPDMYAKEIHWFWSWEVTNALALGDDDALQHATAQLIEHGGEDLDQFYPVFNCLLYHDRRDVLLDAMRKHTFQIAHEKYFPGVEYEVNQKLSDVVVLDYLETCAQDVLLTEDNFDQLCQTLATYADDLQRDGLAEFISWAGGLTSHQWAREDFQFRVKPKRRGWYEDDDDEDEEQEADPAVIHLRNLSYAFLHYARQVENVPLTKADLARGHLVTYILERHRGELQDETANRGSRRRNRSRKGRKQGADVEPNVLLPDHKTLDRYLTRFYGFLATGTYEGAALFELIPTWTRFLQSKELVTAEEGHHALRSLQALSQSMRQIMEKYDSDPALVVNMREWRSNAGI